MRLLHSEPVEVVLVVVDDQLVEPIRDPVEGAVVGYSLLRPVIDVPTIPFIGAPQRMQEPRLGQDAAEARACVVGEDVGRSLGPQPGLYDPAYILGSHRLALHVDAGVLFLEPPDDVIHGPLEGGSLRGGVEEPDDLAPASTTARRAKEHRAGQPCAAEPEKIFAAHRPRHLLLPAVPSFAKRLSLGVHLRSLNIPRIIY